MKKEVFQRIFFAFFISFCFLTICSRSSFIYLFNNWDDSNSYFTMGKMMMNGGVIYRDLFDQKGPLLYFIYGLGYLLSHTSFSGVFLIEIISFTIFRDKYMVSGTCEDTLQKRRRIVIIFHNQYLKQGRLLQFNFIYTSYYYSKKDFFVQQIIQVF